MLKVFSLYETFFLRNQMFFTTYFNFLTKELD